MAGMEKSDEDLIESILAIVDRAQGRATEPHYLAGEPAGCFYRLYWLTVSDVGVRPGCVEGACPRSGELMEIPTFVESFVSSQPGLIHMKVGGEEDIFENLGYLSFSDEAPLAEAYSQLVLAAQSELAHSDPVFQYIEIEARVCGLSDFGGPADKGLGRRVYGAQLRPGESHEIGAKPS